MITPERIRELSAEARSNVETKANDRGDTRWWHPDHFDQEFARLIIQELLTVLKPGYSINNSLKDKATREALIKMGWTPPNEDGVFSEAFETTKEY